MESFKAKAKRKSLIAAVYRKANPNKMTPGFVKKIIDQYDGYEDVLAERLHIKYATVAQREVQRLKEFVKEIHDLKVIKRRNSKSWAMVARANMRREEVRQQAEKKPETPSMTSGRRRAPPPKKPDARNTTAETTRDTIGDSFPVPAPPRRSQKEARKARPLRASRPSISASSSFPEGRHRGNTVGARLEPEYFERHRSDIHVEDTPRRPRYDAGRPSSAPALRSREQRLSVSRAPSSSTGATSRPRLMSAQSTDAIVAALSSPESTGRAAIGKSSSVAGVLRPRESRYGHVTPSTSTDIVTEETRTRQLSEISLSSLNASSPSIPSGISSAAVEKSDILLVDDPTPRHSLHRPRAVSALSDASAHSPPGILPGSRPSDYDLPIVRAKETRHSVNVGWSPSYHYGEFDAVRVVMAERGEGKGATSSLKDVETTSSHVLDAVLRDVLPPVLTSETKRERVSLETPPPTTIRCDDGEWRPVTDRYFESSPSSSSRNVLATATTSRYDRNVQETSPKRSNAAYPSRRFTLLVDNPGNYRLVDIANRYCDSEPRSRIHPYSWRKNVASKTKRLSPSAPRTAEAPRYRRLRAYLSNKSKREVRSANQLALGATASSRAHVAYLHTESMLLGGL
eukprot:g3352.t1